MDGTPRSSASSLYPDFQDVASLDAGRANMSVKGSMSGQENMSGNVSVEHVETNALLKSERTSLTSNPTPITSSLGQRAVTTETPTKAKANQKTRQDWFGWLKTFKFPSIFSFSFPKIFSSSSETKIKALADKLDSATKSLSNAVTSENINNKKLGPTFYKLATDVIQAADNLENALVSSTQRNFRLSDKIENAKNQAQAILLKLKDKEIDIFVNNLRATTKLPEDFYTQATACLKKHGFSQESKDFVNKTSMDITFKDWYFAGK